MPMHASLSVSLLVLLAACTGEAPVPDRTVGNEPLISRALDSLDVPMVLTVSPSDCLSCDARLHRILGAERKLRPEMRILLSRAPTEFERKRLVLEGLSTMPPVLKLQDASDGAEPGLYRRDRNGALRLTPLSHGDSLLREIFRRTDSMVRSP